MPAPFTDSTNVSCTRQSPNDLSKATLPSTPRRPLQPKSHAVVSSPIGPSTPTADVRKSLGVGFDTFSDGFSNIPTSPLSSPLRATRLDSSPLRATTPNRKRPREESFGCRAAEQAEPEAYHLQTGKVWKSHQPLNIEPPVCALPESILRDRKNLFSPAAWFSGTRFERRLPFNTAITGRELFGSKSGRVIYPSLRKYVSKFVSTEHDIYRIVSEDETYIPPFTCSFCNVANGGKYLAIADEDGTIGIVDTRHDAVWEKENPRTQWLAHQNAIFDLCWTSDDQYLVTAAGDQTARLWDVERQACVCVFQGHNCSIKSVAHNARSPSIFATAARDGKIMTWDTRCSGFSDSTETYHRPTDTIRHAHALVNSGAGQMNKKSRRANSLPANQSQSVTTVRFWNNTDNMLISSGAADGLLKVWDLRNHGSHTRREFPSPYATSSVIEGKKRLHGFSSFTLDSRGSRLYAACTDNNIYEFNPNNLNTPIHSFSASTYRCDSFYIKTTVSPDDRFLASGSSDYGLYIWELDAPEKPPLVLRAHRGEVTGVSWSKHELEELASCSDDASVRLWKIDNDYREEEQEVAYRDLRGHAEEGELKVEKRLHVSRPRKSTSIARRDENTENDPPELDHTSRGDNGPPVGCVTPQSRGRTSVRRQTRGNNSRGASVSRRSTGRSITDYFSSPLPGGSGSG
ncbi:uncharacterized protein SPPG_07861 [Spizellomyces punctatus DAOM BR117]|uniref:Uncharacterized protein n=1 Tax=Spizellomyces punctatus (strain DAOM BR117) TaxID=645134 RepID=A0A0L0H7I5_SPIPD|nr:uncharacterized protein SPPG_07861 [Spizellomyces punctatus DAOM BR117]KNC96648.1 hypothetical protein SPPG_07861 [Spizellomyces punctatus DAOM BR117]|eukprot:XP_016604688.1 hypothetical protein SPPG_07861 [Spizellomyces punctatus DAOM BR117]